MNVPKASGHGGGAPERALVVHGHFYQPPRENPWTETVPVEPSAAPAHDWNERITAESYRPNGWARVVDDHDRVVAIVNNYAHLSFNVGPTLASWLDEHAPDVLARMVAGDRAGGGAVAQAFNHMILPLASERDVRTQVRWGQADFRHRFGREPEGIWLPETAVNDAVLTVLAEEGIGFTILAPGQAKCSRPLGGDEPWVDAAEDGIDTRRTYRWRHPERRDLGLDLVFYDGALSHDIAFGASGMASDVLVARAADAAAPAGLACVATDGETFGHHHRFAERVLAHALPVVAPQAGMRVTNLADHLRAAPPTWEVEVWESAWSCTHGVERWANDCGCSTGGLPGSDQRWRASLREALDVLRDAGVEVFERRGSAVLVEPWAARDAYGKVVVGARGLEDFAAEHVKGSGADDAILTEALTLLEQQRHALLMYTSCAWFFWDLAGLETVQCLRYAARAIDLLEELGEDPPVASFLDVLSRAQSNQPEEGDGTRVWHHHVVPARVDERRVVAHLALVELLGGLAGDDLGAFAVEARSVRHAASGSIVAVAGTATLRHRRTGRRTAHAWSAVHLGGLQIRGASRPSDEASDGLAADDLFAAIESGAAATTVLDLLSACFGPETFGIESALPGSAEVLLAMAATDLDRDVAEAVARAVAGDADGTDLVLSLLRLAEHLEVHVDLAPAQEVVYDALVGGPEVAPAHLRLLGMQLGLAVERLGLPAQEPSGPVDS
ncbi:MAG TPA: DUF3536 domain-containing protein [Acidimicrobiales bacterium]|nr:DUF3536 domain-containing protein [Acidimicrobiales bacterium]